MEKKESKNFMIPFIRMYNIDNIIPTAKYLLKKVKEDLIKNRSNKQTPSLSTVSGYLTEFKKLHKSELGLS